MFLTMQLTFRAWTRICWLYWWKMKSCRHEILDWQTITDSTTQQKYVVQRFVTHCNSFTHADVKNQQIWAILSVIVLEVQWNRTGRAYLSLFFLPNNFTVSSDYIPALQPSATDRSWNIVDSRLVPTDGLVATELHRSLHYITYCCHALAPTREVFRVITWAIALSHCPWPLHVHLQQHGGLVNNPQIPDCAGKRTAR